MRILSSSLPSAINAPPVWGIRFVGLSRSGDLRASLRSTNAANDSPNAETVSGDAPDSGKCSRVPEATPDALWQARQFCASSTGKTSTRKSGPDCALAVHAISQIADARIRHCNREEAHFVCRPSLLPNPSTIGHDPPLRATEAGLDRELQYESAEGPLKLRALGGVFPSGLAGSRHGALELNAPTRPHFS